MPVKCEIPDRPLLDGVAVDLSLGGAFVECSEPPAFGTELTIVGDFPGANGLRIPSVVRWAKPGGFGVQFGLLGAQVTHTLSRLVHSRDS